jgi:hypothetical protein
MTNNGKFSPVSIEQTKDTKAFGFVATLPFLSQEVPEHDSAVENDTYFEVVVWRSATNICDQSEGGQVRCDTGRE